MRYWDRVWHLTDVDATLNMSALRGKADIPDRLPDVRY